VLPEARTFHAQLPVKIAFGDGVIAELAPVLAGAGATRALVVIEEPVAAHPAVRAALGAVGAGGTAVDVVVKGPGEPTFALADGMADRVREGGHDAVVGIGGGSALDVAKAARIIADNGGRAREYAAGERIPRPPRLPLVLCPTTAGTGSEVSGASVLTDADAGRKTGFGAPDMRAQHALVDPVLTHGLPAAPTAHAGVDAVAQAIGACTVAHATPLSVAFGLEACRYVGAGLATAVRDGADAGARRVVACGSLTAGLAMNLADCGADHALAQSIGAVCGLPHGLTVGLVVAETLDVSRGDCAPVLERVADALGEPADGTADGSRAVRALRRLLRDVGFPTLRAAGVGDDEVPALVDAAVGEQGFFLDWDAHDWTRADVERAYRAALALDHR
jgi:alcohol dehydrogenase